MANKTAAGKAFRFPEGVMTEEDWVRDHAARVEEVEVDWHSLIDRKKFNRMDNDEQKVYEAQLKKKAEKPQYRAWRGDRDTFYTISKETYTKAKGAGKVASGGQLLSRVIHTAASLPVGSAARTAILQTLAPKRVGRITNDDLQEMRALWNSADERQRAKWLSSNTWNNLEDYSLDFDSTIHGSNYTDFVEQLKRAMLGGKYQVHLRWSPGHEWDDFEYDSEAEMDRALGGFERQFPELEISSIKDPSGRRMASTRKTSTRRKAGYETSVIPAYRKAVDILEEMAGGGMDVPLAYIKNAAMDVSILTDEMDLVRDDFNRQYEFCQRMLKTLREWSTDGKPHKSSDFEPMLRIFKNKFPLLNITFPS